MNWVILILSILLTISILYILYIKFIRNNIIDNKRVRFSNIKQEKLYEKDNMNNNMNNNIDNNNIDNNNKIYDEMSFLEPDYEQKRLEELKFDMI